MKYSRNLGVRGLRNSVQPLAWSRGAWREQRCHIASVLAIQGIHRNACNVSIVVCAASGREHASTVVNGKEREAQRREVRSHPAVHKICT